MTDLNTEKIEKIEESELAYKIWRSISFESKTPTEIADELDTTSQSINNYLKHLLELDLVRKVHCDGRSQPYTINPTTDFSSLFWHYWDNKIQNNTEFSSYNNIIEEMSNNLDKEKLVKKEELEGDLNTFLMNYCVNYFKNNDTSTIKKMLLDDMWDKIITHQFTASFRDPNIEEIIPEHFKTLFTILLSSNINQTSYEIENAVKETFG